MNNSNRVIFNTGFLYIRLIVGLVIGLLTTRIVLKALGETDYGIYMLVAGVVAMLGILNSNMSNTSMRYIAHSLGSTDKKNILTTFNTTLFLHFLVGLVVVLIMLLGGVIMFEYLLNIPNNRVFDAKVVFVFMVITTLVTVISAPYDALINAHENILVLSLVDIFGDVLKLGIAIYLTFSTSNLLILYGLLMLVVQIILRIIKQWYSRVNYDECKIRFRYIDKKLMKSILSFTGWNLFGSFGSMVVTQVKGILLNIFFGVRLNAAEGVARSASTAINMVSTSMTRAINPQLMKSEGGGDRKKMLYITEVSTRYSLFLFGLFAVPVFLEAPYLLKVWLVNVPEFAVIFFQISVLTMMLEKFTFPITDAIRAIGDIRKITTIEASLRLLNIPIAYLIFKLGYGPTSIYIVALVISCVVFFNRLYFGKRIAGLQPIIFIKGSILPFFFPFLVAVALALIPYFLIEGGFLRLCGVTFVFMGTLTVLFWTFGMQIDERDKLKSILFSFIKRG
jgi:O-antigen/teichoic acid export membrane protein